MSDKETDQQTQELASIDESISDKLAELKPTEQQREALLETVSSLPNLPGVYRYFDVTDQVLYVGKARSLKNRVSSYFKQNHEGTRVGLMVSRISRIETTVVRTEAEALLLENNLIKRLAPRFNILFRDDKSYPYLRITAHAFPRITYYRGAVNKKDVFYGPYPNAWAVRESIHLLQKLFMLRTCEDTVFSHRDRPCLLYQIKRCSGPCVKRVDRQGYEEDVHSAREFLDGHTDQVMGQLQKRMGQYSEQLAFEKAAQMRDQISALSGVLQQQAVEDNTQYQGDKEVDIIAVKLQGGKACVNLAMVRGGRHLGDRAYFPSNVADGADVRLVAEEQEFNATLELQKKIKQSEVKAAQTTALMASQTIQQEQQEQQQEQQALQDMLQEQREVTVLEAFIAQHYIDLPIPTGLILSHGVSAGLMDALQEQAERRVQVVTHPRGQRKIWLDMAEQGARLSLTRLLSQEGVQRERTQALAQALDLGVEQLDQLRVECFDISHTAGEATMASCVVYEDHKMQPSQYRRYNIQGVTPGDDYAAMKQVLLRRYEKITEAMENACLEEEAEADITADVEADIDVETEMETAMFVEAKTPAQQVRMPDLVLIDGGKGQISVAREVFEQLGLDASLLVGVEKGEKRRVGLEELVFADAREKVYLGSDSAALMLIAEIRDEAHRFAITGMRARRANVRTGASRLEDISGIGPKRRASLLQRFGGVKGVAAASAEELATVEGISKELAGNIYRALR